MATPEVQDGASGGGSLHCLRKIPGAGWAIGGEREGERREGEEREREREREREANELTDFPGSNGAK
jgi:hypothetical protein